MRTEKEQIVIDILQSEWTILQTSVLTLRLSVEKCKAIGVKESYSFEEQESFDSLTSKFNRSSDIFTQKVLRSAWMLLHEPFEPFIDRMNKAEKMGLIQSADQLIEIRDLRNQIAHEYIPEAIRELIPEVIELTTHLFGNIRVCQKFIETRNWLNER